MLIIGVGNLQRGDDGAGIIAAERLRALGINTQVCSGEASELIELWTGEEEVMVVDCVVTGAPAGSVHVLDGSHSVACNKLSGSTHGLGLGEAVKLGRTLGRLPEKLRIYGIEGVNFEIGDKMSAEVERGVAEVVNRIGSDIKTRTTS